MRDQLLASTGFSLDENGEMCIRDRWTTDNPGGTDEHFGIVHYGTDPNGLSQTTKSPIRLNRYHSDAIFRVRVEGLSPQTKYYYTVESMGSTGKNDGVQSGIQQFTTR